MRQEHYITFLLGQLGVSLSSLGRKVKLSIAAVSKSALRSEKFANENRYRLSVKVKK